MLSSRTFFDSASTPAIHPGILEQIEFALEDETLPNVIRTKTLFLEDVTAAPKRLEQDPSKPEATNLLKMLYTGGSGGASTAHRFGFTAATGVADYQAAFRIALEHYVATRQAPSTEAAGAGSATPAVSKRLPDVLGVKCFSLRAMGVKTATDFDREIMATHAIPVSHFFMRMSSSSTGMVVMVEKTVEGALQSRLALVYDPKIKEYAANPFRIEVVFAENPLRERANAKLALDATAPFSLVDPSDETSEKLVPLTQNFEVSLRSLAKPNATVEKVHQCFAAYYASKGLTCFDAPPAEAAISHASGGGAAEMYARPFCR